MNPNRGVVFRGVSGQKQEQKSATEAGPKDRILTTLGATSTARCGDSDYTSPGKGNQRTNQETPKAEKQMDTKTELFRDPFWADVG